LKPEGYIEFIDWCTGGDECDDGTVEGTATQRFWMLMRPLEVHGLDTMILGAGFENYHETIRKLAMGPWPADKRKKELGRWMQLMLESGFEAYSLAPLHEDVRNGPRRSAEIDHRLQNRGAEQEGALVL
jgi:hypothetical protein